MRRRSALLPPAPTRFRGPSAERAGEPLPPAVQQELAPRFRQDFSQVRVHTDASAAATARKAGAQALTIGDHMFFDSGRYEPFTRAGRWLLAHELAHTLQQRSSGQASEAHSENDANRAANAALTGKNARVASPASASAQRQPATPATADVERTNIVNVSQKTQRDPKSRAWDIGWRMLTRYFPEYSSNVAGVGYEEKEPGVRVDVKQSNVKGKQAESAMVTLGRRFVDDTSDDTLRERIEEMRASLSSKMQGMPDPRKTPGLTAVSQLMAKELPAKQRRASIQYDANLPGLSTEFKAGTFPAGKTKVTLTAPRLYFGKAFLDLPTDADKVAKLKAEFAKIDQWCVEHAQLTKDDLQDEDITLRIRGLDKTKLTSLRDTVNDAAVKEYADSLLTRSTPLEQGLSKQADGSVSAVIGNVTLVVLPDVTGVQGIVGGKTSETPPPLHLHWVVKSGVIRDLTGVPPDTMTITIQTKCGPGVDPTSQFGYGRGTTQRDKSVEGKSLKVHEGSHGLDFVQFVKTHTWPVFRGTAGMQASVFVPMATAYRQARDAYIKGMEDTSVQSTDCVGITIDEFNQKHNIQAGKQCP